MNSMERMALHLFAAWTDLQSLMKDYTLIALEGDEATDYGLFTIRGVVGV